MIDLLYDMTPTTKPLKPLCQFLSAWKTIPRISRWLLCIRARVRPSIQMQTTLFQRRGLVSNTDSKCPYPKTRAMQIAWKRSNRTSPSEQAGLQFFQLLFVVPKRDGGLRPILDLRPINRALGKRPFRMLKLSQGSRFKVSLFVT